MNKFLLIMMMAFSFSAFSRVYIQCADMDSWDRAVINLNGEESTLFMTNGVHMPDELRILKDLNLVSETELELIYETQQGNIKDVVYIPVKEMIQSPSYFSVVLEHINMNSGHSHDRKLSCFSSIYDD